ncbi:MAG: AAA family ATPase [Saprospiraceae bacterium]|nr:AAA family ATPase [Saprospiraceae bacterium]
MHEKEILLLNEEQHSILDRMEELRGVLFLTGKAGTGKSTLLNLFKRTIDHKVITLAPTGVAAILIGGQTIHSFFKFPPGWITPNDYRPLPKKMIQQIKMIIIDEISMVRADLLDHIDAVLRLSAKNDLAFGGIPMIWIGDLYQLPPIVSTNEEREYFGSVYPSPFFFSSKVMQRLDNFELIELNQVFRQNEMRFIRLLNRIRLNEADEEDLNEINTRHVQSTATIQAPYVTLTSTNSAASVINLKALNAIDQATKIYTATTTGIVHQSQHPADLHLSLKVGAQIMTIKNDPLKKFYNGSLGVVTELRENSIIARMNESDEIVEIGQNKWDVVRYKLKDNTIHSEILGSYTQLPVKLAWAMTIHKSQGKTFERILVDLGFGAFESGQVYVALSRCKSIEGVFLKEKLNWKDIRTDERVTEFLKAWS